MSQLLDAAVALRKILGGERQTDRILRLSFPHEDGPPGTFLAANRFEGEESLSRDFRFRVEVLSDDPSIALKDVLGRMVTLELICERGKPRYFNGYVFDFRFLKNDGGFAWYEMLLLPWLAFLRYRHDNRLFHDKTVGDQTREIFDAYDMRDWQTELLGEDPVMTEACQFEESDYNYVHRRWEALGWHYWYEHRKDGHTLMLCGDSTQCKPIEEGGRICWRGEQSDARWGVWSMSRVRTLASTACTASSFDFKSVSRAWPVSMPTNNVQGKVPSNLEVYEYAGAYGYKDMSAGEARTRLHIREIEAAAKYFELTGDDDRARPGHSFQLEASEDDPLADLPVERDDEFLILSVKHEAANNYQTQSEEGAKYEAIFTCLRKKIPWHPGRGFNSEQPRIYGLQTATVVGPEGEEIYTDEYGRVRIQYHWDRLGQFDHKSSAWVRVATSWTGPNFGAVSVPRIKTEVIVQFLDGNPDRPLITGMVPNINTMPPWPLPANKTQSGILSRSTPGGTYENANAIRFEDKKGQEEVWLHAERDQRIEVEHDESHWVGHDRTKTIDHDETVHVKHDRTETVDHDETITIHNNRTERVDHDETISIGDNRKEDVGQNETISIGENRTVTIGGNKAETIKLAKAETIGLGKAETIGLAKVLTIGGAYQTSVGLAMNTSVGLSQTEQVGQNKGTKVGARYTIDVADELVITVGKATLTMKSDGTITINGHTFNLGTTAEQQFHADGNITMKAKKIEEN